MVASEYSFSPNAHFKRPDVILAEKLWRLDAMQHVLKSEERFTWRGNQFHWEGKEKDWEILQQVFCALEKTQGAPDKEFRPWVGEFDRMLRNSPLMHMLNDPHIKVSKAQNGKTPYLHTLEVFSGINSDKIVELLQEFGIEAGITRVVVRLTALLHDVGKIFGAVGKESQFHPFLSVILMQDFLDKCTSLSNELKEIVVFVIQYHHTYQEISFNRIGPKEQQRRFGSAIAAILLHELSRADVPTEDLRLQNEKKLASIRPDVAELFAS